ncbi:hypothetical protein HMPREF9318_00207 [Streptococcus urinalis FB127-CNA-2]|uniref:S-adenosylmethionine-dependent methyltransferase n=1 Tax=Streptococcus urinalis 2285-97 TaxID=764291 RepID=G5KFA7_9STRE|nr:class I SAM-dependent rRNA methyltransferase [Streptococcus urinalis]EHJ55643.1 S-adenosylmethionine-dependent methyltransferase [Streptococcus urinalis 2285-97]EKS22009.1 hypothetical protein HMPREF9318_00207 [Streptococcus urinalis FB127-CNA-2]VEF31821.1 LSU m5C1962 methyltransferase RlmI [Streptococcus urinalis]
MKKLQVDSLAEKKIKQGIQLLYSRDIKVDFELNQLVSLFNKNNQFLGTAYLSEQNKGIGWVLSKNEVVLDLNYFIALFKVAKSKRHDYILSTQTNAFRVFNQDGDHFGGLTIDIYDDFALFSWYNEFVVSQKAIILEAFNLVFPEINGIYEKLRIKNASYQSAHLYGKEAPEKFLIKENDINYQIFLNDGLMTGIFLDQHDVRNHLTKGLANQKSVLNLFSYTAAFSVASVVGGAKKTDSVDLAKRSKELSIAHFKANNLPLDNHNFIIMDVFEYFKYAKRKQLKYDLIIIDPPSFARNKKQTFSVQKDYHRLVSQSLDILEPNGSLILSTNAANLTKKQFKKQIEKGLGKVNYDITQFQQLPNDFTVNNSDESSNYLKVFTIKVTQ